MISKLRAIYHSHYNFILLLSLFITFRAFILLAYRPGGHILDFSDYYFYQEFAQMDRQGYVPYKTLWTTYPPLFPTLMINMWRLSNLLPPWEFHHLWFRLMFGGTLLIFETGNFILIYLISLKLYPSQKHHDASLKVVGIYACLFVPVYTLTGWFESYPLFFYLLSLYLLIQRRPYLSAFFSGVGFMVKLIPLLLIPLGVRVMPIKSTWARLKIKWLNLDIDLWEVAKYATVFIITVTAIGYPFYKLNPDLILSPFRMTGFRLPWETVWALLEGNYDYGIIPLDMRNLTWPPPEMPQSTLPWLWITVGFTFIYTFLYTRHIKWQQPHVMVAFAGLTYCMFLLYSKGYSPQWLIWLLVFSSILLPNMRGVMYAIILSTTNIIESNIFFIIFPDEHWLLATTILIRTGLIIILPLEFSLIIYPHLHTETVIRFRRNALIVILTILIVGVFPATNRLYHTYVDSRLEQSPYHHSITWLSEQPVKEAILLNDHTTYNWYYPYLRNTHAFFMLDDYSDANNNVTLKTELLLTNIAQNHKAVWIFDSDPAITTNAESAMHVWLANSQLAHQADIDEGRLYLFILQ